MTEYRLSETSSNFIHFLRAASSQIVLIGHCAALNQLIEISFLSFLPSFSVMVFFVLSGFVISYSTSLKGESYGLSNYLVDRFSRIYITLLPALLITFLLGFIYYLYFNAYPFNINIKYLFTCITMQQENPLLLKIQYMLPDINKYKFIGIFGDNLPLWSLSLEWWYYVFFGLFFYTKFKTMKIQHFILLVCCLPFVVGYMFLPGRAGYGLSFIWFSGVLINYLLSKNIKISYSNWLFYIFLVFTIISLKIISNLSILSFIVFFLFSIIYFNGKSSNSNWNKFFKLAKWPGNYSYSLYVIHYPILLLLKKLGIITKNGPKIKFINVFSVANLIIFI